MKLEKSLIYKNFYKDLAERYGEEKAARSMTKQRRSALPKLFREYKISRDDKRK